MSTITVRHTPQNTLVFIAAEEIAHLQAVELSMFAARYVKIGTNLTNERVAGVAFGPISGFSSGQVLNVVTEGIVSGVVCASSIKAGDRVTLVSGGRIAAYNGLTETDSLSGIINMGLASGGSVSGLIVMNVGRLALSSGSVSGINPGLGLTSGRLLVGKVLGKALTSGGGAGSGIQVLVTLGG